MKAPQTIYLTPLLVEGCGKSLSKRVTENDVVYIRKDLLLEWAKELTSEPYDRTTVSALKHQIAHYLLEKYDSL